MSPSVHVLDVTIKNFEESVIMGSSRLPVLVDFWSATCQPCKTLTPLLEKLAEEYAGAFLLAKVDVDHNPEIAQAFRIQSVPTVVLLANGQPVDAFTGVKSDAELREFLTKYVGGGPAQSPVTEALELAAAGQAPAAMGLLQDWLATNGDDHQARAVLGGMMLDDGDPVGARGHCDLTLPDGEELPEVQSLVARLQLAEGAGDTDALRAKLESDPRDVGARVELGRALVAGGQTEDGLEELLEAAMRDMQFEDGLPRKAMIEVFQALGAADPLTLEFQQRLSVLLCS